VTRHFLTIEQQGPADLDSIYELSTSPIDDETLKGQAVALLFERPSLRTAGVELAAVHRTPAVTPRSSMTKRLVLTLASAPRTSVGR